MKTPLATIAFVAMASSLAVVGTVELLRGSRPGSQPARPGEAPSEAAGPPAARRAAPLVTPTRGEDRLDELERRIAALELDAISRRSPVTSVSGRRFPEDELRDLVLTWVGQERAARSQLDQLEAEDKRHKEEEFEARYSAHVLAQEHDLLEWQEDKLTEVILEIEARRTELEEGIDPLTDDPVEAERRWAEFEAWTRRRFEEELGPALYEQLFGDH